VEIYRFDPEVSRPVTAHGSDFRIGPLASVSPWARIQVMHLEPGGSIGRHPAVSRQLLAVVAGSGRVSGGDGQGRDISAGYAALWTPGEEHETRTDGGLTAVCIEGEFDLDAFLVTKDIVVLDHDAAWADWFEQLRGFVWPAVEGLALEVEHVGSTSVPGLAAKPIIDLDVVVATDEDVSAAIDALATLGYRWRGDLGVEGRQAFLAPSDADLPPHHLYVVVDQNKAHLDHVLLRDLLREDDGARERYAELKRANADLRDIDAYVAGKAELVASLLAHARAERGLPPRQ
jgi:GrpB-like predicted nucleotidyltransferase (UPF0157 family)/quercetin dioxygenase-like cupin family protein